MFEWYLERLVKVFLIAVNICSSCRGGTIKITWSPSEKLDFWQFWTRSIFWNFSSGFESRISLVKRSIAGGGVEVGFVSWVGVDSVFWDFSIFGIFSTFFSCLMSLTPS